MNLFDDDSALDNVLIALPRVRRRGFDAWRDLRADSAAEQEAAAVLARVGLAGQERTPAKSLSYGERRALEIGVALAAAPRLLFLDEPTAGLGANGTRARWPSSSASSSGTLTIVIIEHDMRFLFRLADTRLGAALGPGDRRAARPTSCATTPGCADPASGAAR